MARQHFFLPHFNAAQMFTLKRRRGHVRETRCVSRRKQKLFIWPSKVDAIRNHSLRLIQTEQQNLNVRICSTHFMDEGFMNPVEYTKAVKKKTKKQRVHSNFAMTNWHF